jgi:hypothetical protein
MIGFVALGIVMLLWVLTWEGPDEVDHGSAAPSDAAAELPDTRL